MIHACARSHRLEEAVAWLGRMERDAVAPNLVAYNSVLHACAKAGAAGRAEEWFERLAAASIAPDRVSYNCVLDAHARNGTAAAGAAARWLERMRLARVRPDIISYTSALSLCRRLGAEAATREQPPREPPQRDLGWRRPKPSRREPLRQEERTTISLRNLPNDYTLPMLLALLDSKGFGSRYDFVYLPVDFARLAGFGYAFVNLVSNQDSATARQPLPPNEEMRCH